MRTDARSARLIRNAVSVAGVVEQAGDIVGLSKPPSQQVRMGLDQGGWPRLTATRAAKVLTRVKAPNDAFLTRLLGLDDSDAYSGGPYPCEHGQWVQPLLVREACRRLDLAAEDVLHEPGTFVHPSRLELDLAAMGAEVDVFRVGSEVPAYLRAPEWAAASPDAVHPRANLGFEVKTTSPETMGEAWHYSFEKGRSTAQVPARVEAQARWQMFCCDLDAVAIVLGVGTRVLVEVLERDAELEARMVEHCRAFYVEHLAPFALSRRLVMGVRRA